MSVHGEIHWTELMTRQPAKAAAFFEQVLGWTVTPMPMPDGPDYRVCMVGDRPAAGIFDITRPQFEGTGDGWVSYIHVEDVDAACARVEAEGGSVRQAPFDVPEVGRIAMIADPTGVVIGFITPAAGR